MPASIAAVPLDRFPGLSAIPLDKFEELPAFPGMKALAADAEAGGACHAIVAYTKSLFTRQVAGVTHNDVLVD